MILKVHFVRILVENIKKKIINKMSRKNRFVVMIAMFCVVVIAC